MMHVTVMMLSYASLIVGSLLGIFFLILLKGKGENINLKGNSYGIQYTNSKLVNTAFYRTETPESYPNRLLEKSSLTKGIKFNSDSYFIDEKEMDRMKIN